MTKYLALIHRTLEGSKTIAEGPARLEASTKLAGKYGCTLEQFYLTTGEYDQVVIFDAPDELSMVRYKLAVEAIGAIKISNLRLFSTEEYRNIVATM